MIAEFLDFLLSVWWGVAPRRDNPSVSARAPQAAAVLDRVQEGLSERHVKRVGPTALVVGAVRLRVAAEGATAGDWTQVEVAGDQGEARHGGGSTPRILRFIPRRAGGSLLEARFVEPLGVLVWVERLPGRREPTREELSELLRVTDQVLRELPT